MKRIVALIVALSLGMVLLMGCGSRGPSPSETASEKSAAQGSTEPGTASAANSKENNPEDYKGTITQWTWMVDWEKDIVDIFSKKYPNVKVELVGIANTDYQVKIQTTLAAGSELPDILPLESNYQGVFMDMDLFDDMSKAPYNFDKSLIIDYLINMNINQKGELIGLPLMPGPSGLFYRRDLAKQYLGTDDPEELAKMLPDWDSFIEVGKKIVKDSNGKVFAVAGIGDVWSALNGQNLKPYIENGKVVVKDHYLDSFEMLKKVRDAGIDAKLEQWTAPWNASFANGNVIFYPGAVWYVDLLKSYDAEGSGRWGMTLSPGGGYSQGGTTYCIPHKAANKELAWLYIYANYGTVEGNIEKVKVKNDLPNLKEAYDDPVVNRPVEFLNNQVIAPMLLDTMSKMKAKNYTKYDGAIGQAVSLQMKAMNANAITPEQAVENIEKELLKELQK